MSTHDDQPPVAHAQPSPVRPRDGGSRRRPAQGLKNGSIHPTTISLLQLRAGQILGTAMGSLIIAIAHIGFLTPAALIAEPIPGMPPGQDYSEQERHTA
ncbi:hypothetical protein [Micromonospora sp. NPDC048063]|uniref:hypothetical protein n=1 Tax=Micromonospora sp. NPDC048063 TaxID=3364256 RepID=UPI00371A3CC8